MVGCKVKKMVVAVYGGGLQGEKTSKYFLFQMSNNNMFFLFFSSLGGWVGESEANVIFKFFF